MRELDWFKKTKAGQRDFRECDFGFTVYGVDKSLPALNWASVKRLNQKQ